jgi:hypothetical protein
MLYVCSKTKLSEINEFVGMLWLDFGELKYNKPLHARRYILNQFRFIRFLPTVQQRARAAQSTFLHHIKKKLFLHLVLFRGGPGLSPSPKSPMSWKIDSGLKNKF